MQPQRTLLLLLFSAMSANAQPAGDSFEDFARAQEVLTGMALAHGGGDALGRLQSTSFETESTYFAFHQSPGVGEDWDRQEQARHYAIDLVGDAAAFGRDMEEWSFHDKYTRDRIWRVDNERRVYETSEGGGVASYLHVWYANPSVIAKHLLQVPHDVRHIGRRAQHEELAFVDPRGRMASLLVEAESGLIARLELISRVPPFGDTVRFFEFSDYASVDGVAVPRTIRTGLGEVTEFEHRLRNVRVNEPIDSYLAVPTDYEESPAAARHPWRLDRINSTVHVATNGVYNVPIVEFSDHLLAYNASRSHSDVEGVLEAVQSAFPAKPLTHALLSHHHFDRAGSAGAYAEHGARLLIAREYEERVRDFVQGRRLAAVSNERSDAARPEFLFVQNQQVLEDPLQHVQVLHVPDNGEAGTLFILYLEKTKILIHEGDLFRKYRNGPLRRQRRGSLALENFIAQSGLDVEILLGNRGVPATLKDLHDTNRRGPLR